MVLLQTPFEGLVFFELNNYSDERGLFAECWRSEWYEKLGIQELFVQDCFSVSHKNVLRGMHYQIGQGKMVWVTHGTILDVAVDMRPQSATYKKHFKTELSITSPKRLYIPPGFAHGFYVMSDYAVVNYKLTTYHDKSLEGGFIWNDLELGIEWPCQKPILGQRDANFLPFARNADRQ